MSRRVCITGLGPVSATGLGVESFWECLREGQSKLSTIDLFDPAGFDCHVGGQVPDYKIRDFVPKSYRKATKVMARDIELAVIAADLAARDAGLNTPGTDTSGGETTYPGARSGCNIGAGLIAAELNELTDALSASTDDAGDFSIHRWGQEGMQRLTPLWLLKYLPNMLACHVTIVHDLRGPSNTITCGEPSGSLSVCESVRAIQRGAADCCFAGGAESKLNPMAYLRQQFSGVHTASGNDDPATAIKPLDTRGDGTATGEGGAILILEALETARARGAETVYAEVAGFAATQSINRAAKNRAPAPEGQALQNAANQALNRAGLSPDDIDFIVPSANGVAAFDQAEAAALAAVFGDRSAQIPLVTPKPLIGSCCAGVSGPDLVAACLCLKHQTLPKTINRESPLPGTHAGFESPQEANLKHGLVLTAGFSGQTTAIVLSKPE